MYEVGSMVKYLLDFPTLLAIEQYLHPPERRLQPHLLHTYSTWTMKGSDILRALRTIKWRYPTHHSKYGRRPEAEALVKEHYEAKKLENRGAEEAIIV